MPMEGAVTAAVTEVLLAAAAPGMASPAIAPAQASVVDGTEADAIGEDIREDIWEDILQDGAIILTGGMSIPTSVLILTIPITPPDIGLLNATRTVAAIGSGSRIIELVRSSFFLFEKQLMILRLSKIFLQHFTYNLEQLS